MPSIWAYALYSPHGRLTDWFRTPSDAPQPRAWREYRARDVQLSRQYIGDMSLADARRVFATADRDVFGETCRTSPQARMRDSILGAHLLDMVADIPSRAPAE